MPPPLTPTKRKRYNEELPPSLQPTTGFSEVLKQQTASREVVNSGFAPLTPDKIIGRRSTGFFEGGPITPAHQTVQVSYAPKNRILSNIYAIPTTPGGRKYGEFVGPDVPLSGEGASSGVHNPPSKSSRVEGTTPVKLFEGGRRKRKTRRGRKRRTTRKN